MHLAEDIIRCNKCGCKATFWLPLADKRSCCKENAQLEAQRARRKAYPRNEGQAPCKRFLETSVCDQFERNGWCHFSHRVDELMAKLEGSRQQRCSVCTLPMPCNIHFPKLGTVLDARERKLIASQIAQVIGNQNQQQQAELEGNMQKEEIVSAEEKDTKRYVTREIVAVLFKDEYRFAYLVNDDPRVGICSVVTCVPPDRPKSVTLQRTKVFKLRGLLYRK